MDDTPETDPQPGPNDEWSNERCIEIAISDAFPASVIDIAVQKNVVERFFDYYLSGKIPKGFGVTDLVFSVISIMPIHPGTEEFIWDKCHFDDNGTLFTLTPEDEVKPEIKNIQENATNVKRKDVAETDTLSEEVTEDVEEMTPQSESSKQYPSTSNENATNANLENIDISDSQEINENANNLNSDTEESTKRKEWSSIKFPKTIKWFQTFKKRDVEINRPQYGPVENAAFTASCVKLLELWHTDENARIVLKYFFGVIALTLIRGVTKTYKHIINRLSSMKFLNFISDITRSVRDFRYIVPHKRCIKRSYGTFRKKQSNIGVMIAKIVLNSYHIHAEGRNRPELFNDALKVNIYKFTILNSTADFGLGLVILMRQLVGTNADIIDTVVKCTYCNETAVSWRKLKNYINKYMAPESKEGTHYWARLIDNNYFEDLCCMKNYHLAVILAVFIEKIHSIADIWKSIWVEKGKQRYDLEALKKRGLEMYVKYESEPREGIKLLLSQLEENAERA